MKFKPDNCLFVAHIPTMSAPEPQITVVNLQSRGIDETQAADLRDRLKTFTDDWDCLEAAIYDQSPTQ
jgi:hypothetical protein